MPVVNITMIKGRTDEQKTDLYREVTEAIQRTTGAPAESVRIILNEIEPKHFAVAGKPKTGPSS